MRISVILPTKDRGPDVARTLSALLEQDLPTSDYEVVVVDNASRDENAAALRACDTPGTLVHLGDESGDMVKEFDYASWSAVLRQYFSARTVRDPRWAHKLVHIPLGYGANYYGERGAEAWAALDDGGRAVPPSPHALLSSLL